MRRLTITGLIAALTVGTVVLLASAPPSAQDQETGNRAPFWPGTKGRPVLKEWYTDIPWHQKLGTFAGNEIDEALVLPYEALGEPEKKFCTDHKLTPEDCMLELGINNVLGTLRTDTLYNPQGAKIRNAKECQDPTLPCIEVELELSSFWTRRKGSGAELQPRPFGKEPPTNDFYGGYTITDGTTYAPQMPWYMAHYCDSFFPQGPDAQDPVCYGDYFSPFNDGFNLLPRTQAAQWPNSAPWSVFPSGTPPAPTNHCKPGETKCTLVMAGFDLREVPMDPEQLPTCLPDAPQTPCFQYKKYNDFLLTWFNGALKNFPLDLAKDTRHFPWSGATISWKDFIYPRAVLNPFLGQFDFSKTAGETPTGCDITVNGPDRATRPQFSG